MSSRLRRFLVLTTLLALVLAAAGASATPPHTKVAGIDVDSTTIPELQELMNRHRLSSVVLTNFYLRRIRQLDPELKAVITVSPTAREDARAADRARRSGDDPRCSGFRSSSRTTSTPPACRRRPAPGRSPEARPAMRSS